MSVLAKLDESYEHYSESEVTAIIASATEKLIRLGFVERYGKDQFLITPEGTIEVARKLKDAFDEMMTGGADGKTYAPNPEKGGYDAAYFAFVQAVTAQTPPAFLLVKLYMTGVARA